MTSTVQRYTPPPAGGRAGSQAASIEQSRAIADVQAAVTVAQLNPRDMVEAEREMEYVCGRLSVAEQAFYRVQNRGTGPSVHLMRELARIWGNIDYGVKELSRDDIRGESEVLATCWDMQKNTRSSRTFIVPHARMAAGGRKQLDDLQDIYLNNQNIGARAVRECIETVLPRWFTERAQEVCRTTLSNGEGEPLSERIQKMLVWFRDRLGVSQQQLEANVGGQRGAWTADDVAQLKIAGKSIVAGEISRDEVFPPIAAEIVNELRPDDPEAPAATSALAGKVKQAEPPVGPDAGEGRPVVVDPVTGEQQDLVDWVQVDQSEPEPEPEPEPASAKNKRESKREQQAVAKAAKGTQMEGKPKGHTDRVEAALAKAHAANDTAPADQPTETPETTPAAEPETQASPDSSDPVISEDPSEDPSEPEPTTADDALRPDTEQDEQKALDDAYADELAAEQRKQAALDELRDEVAAEQQATAEPVKAPADWDGAKPATREQLQELAQCIAAAGWQPTAEGKAQWFAWLSQEVDRDIAGNNQLSRGEITKVIQSMNADASAS